MKIFIMFGTGGYMEIMKESDAYCTEITGYYDRIYWARDWDSNLYYTNSSPAVEQLLKNPARWYHYENNN